MKSAHGKLLLASLAVLSFAAAPVADAALGGGGGRGGGGGGGAHAAAAGGGAAAARAGGGAAGGRQAAQIDNSRVDARTNNVRSNSVNNVNNVNVNRNVNVDQHGGCCGGWNNDYHPVATAAAVTATAAIIGSMVRTVPANCVPVNYGGIVYQQCGTTWYQPQGTQYMVVNPPY